jgi:hypothetical protein
MPGPKACPERGVGPDCCRDTCAVLGPGGPTPQALVLGEEHSTGQVVLQDYLGTSAKCPQKDP